MRQLQENDVLDKLDRCRKQGKYSGKITDIHKGAIFIRLDIGVNAVAHKCLDNRYPAKNDIVSFVVNRLDYQYGVALGVITRIIRQGM